MSKHRTVGAAATWRSRTIAAVVIGTAVTMVTAGCSMISTQATTITYNAADGVGADAGPIEVRNAFIVAGEDGTAGNLLAAIVNSSDRSQTLTIEVGEGAATSTQTVRVPARSVVSLGSGDDEPLLIEGLGTKPGASVPAYFQAGDAEGALVAVPVLDGTLEYLAPFVP